MQDDRTLNLRQRQRPARWFAAPVERQSSGMRFGNMEIRPLGGGLVCPLMVLF
jgi:hypothetical protein